ncbi:MAG: hypothetical protein LLG37_01805 [Spirochaetia bacterium]|nr:hypothetical protein [Spirochaetia bacterium]
MKKIISVSMFLFFFCCICNAADNADAAGLIAKFPYKKAAYVQKLTSYSSDNAGNVTYNDVRVKDGMIRCDTLDSERKIKQTTIVRDGFVYVTYPGSGKGIKNSVTPGNMPFLSMGREAAGNAEKTGTAAVTGEQCGIYEYTYTLKVLFMESVYRVQEYRNRDGFVMKSVTTEQGAEGKKPTVLEVVKLDKSPHIMNAADFEIDKKVSYTDYTALTNSLAGAFSGNGESGAADKTTGTPEAEEYKDADDNAAQEAVKKEVGDAVVEKAVEGAAGAIFNGIFGR